MGNSENEKKLSQSKHIFAWPFKIFDEKGKSSNGRKSAKKFEQYISNLTFPQSNKKVWEERIIDPENLSNAEDFALYQYLSVSGRKIFCKSHTQGEESQCRIFRYAQKEHEDMIYYIKKAEKAFDKEKEIEVKVELELPIENIELHVYKHNIAILFIEAYFEIDDYQTEDKNKVKPIVDNISRVNGYGRRVSIPFLPKDGGACSLCADQLGIVVKDSTSNDSDPKECIITDFRSIAKEIHDKKGETVENPAGYAAFIDYLLFPGEYIKYKNANPNNMLHNPNIFNQKKFRLEPIADDRMIGMVIIASEEISEKVKEIDFAGIKDFKRKSVQNKENSEQDDVSDISDIYTLAVLDNSDCCPDLRMKQEFFDKAAYFRWKEYGTIYVATEYSFVCFTGDKGNINDEVWTPFITEYKYLLSLVLAQKMGIQYFDQVSGEIAQEYRQNIFKPKKKLKQLYEEYVMFKNQILILEVSSQEQGIQIYQLLQNRFLIEKEQKLLEQQFGSLYELSNISTSSLLGKIGLLLAVISLIVSFTFNVLQFSKPRDADPDPNKLLWVIIPVGGVFLIFIISETVSWYKKMK